MARILIATDAWHPQINGVVRTLDTTTHQLRKLGHIVEVIEPTQYFKFPVPFYPEIELSLPRPGRVYDRIRQFEPDHVHISTEALIGMFVRQFCVEHGWKFTTSYHTKYPEYLYKLASVPESWSYRLFRWFHHGASTTMVATPSLEEELRTHGFTVPMKRWSRGVDQTLFRDRGQKSSPDPRPVMLYVGRVSAEKGIEDFLKLNLPGSKVIVGDGPMRTTWQQQYPDTHFLGYRRGDELADCYASADVFVFPSKTDTFGLVVIEALACGLPVAAYPATGPKDILRHDSLGAVHADLATAVERALALGDRQACLEEAKQYTWENCTQQFLSNLVPR